MAKILYMMCKNSKNLDILNTRYEELKEHNAVNSKNDFIAKEILECDFGEEQLNEKLVANFLRIVKGIQHAHKIGAEYCIPFYDSITFMSDPISIQDAVFQYATASLAAKNSGWTEPSSSIINPEIDNNVINCILHFI